jgi:hypothetical protein
MNVFFAIAWFLLCLLSFATDIDYVEHTLTYKIFTAFIQLFILSTSIITAAHLYKSNKSLVRRFSLFANYSCVITAIFSLLFTIYHQPSIVISFEFLVIAFIYCVFTLPFILNIKAIKAI